MDQHSSITVFDHAFLNALGIPIDDIGYYISLRKHISLDQRFDRPFRSEFMTVLIVNQGVMSIRVNLLDEQVTANQLLLVMPRTLFEMTKLTDDVEVTTLLLDMQFMGSSGLHPNGKAVFELFATSYNLLSLTEEECSVLTCMLRVMQHQVGPEDSVLLRKDIARHAFLAFMLHVGALHRKYKTDVVPSTVTRKEELTLRFVQLLSNHFREERSVQFYADQLFVTAKYLSTAIKEVTGKSPGTLIDDAVVAEAKILLSNPASSVAETAEALSFSDQSFFGKYFKKHSGYTPSEYRQQYWTA